MKEITGNLWDYFGRPNYVVCITTNGYLRNDGTGVMGRGCAREAKRYVPGIERNLGRHIKANGNVVGWIGGELPNILSFPVKHVWYEKADTELIKQSVEDLQDKAERYPGMTFILPRPGCGNGQLSYAEVRPLLIGLPDNVHVIDFATEPA